MELFKLQTFLCYYEQDVEKFQKYVETEGGIWEGYKRIRYLNYLNQPVGRQYVCLYHFHKELDMEVLC